MVIPFPGKQMHKKAAASLWLSSGLFGHQVHGNDFLFTVSPESHLSVQQEKTPLLVWLMRITNSSKQAEKNGWAYL